MQIENDKVIILHYTLKDDNDAILDQSNDGSFVYLHGAMNIIPGLERALTGKSVGDDLSVTVPPEEGYGLRDEGHVQDVPRTMFEAGADIQLGMQFHAQGPNSEMLIVTVTELKDDMVVVDANHPLAGKVLNFEVKVIDIRDASEAELSHGHVHGEHGHHH